MTYEYALISGVNDTEAHAAELIKLLGGKLCHVNLIPVNEVEGTGYRRDRAEKINGFRDMLTAGGVNATVRRAMGRDIEAACGQLRAKAMKDSGQTQTERRECRNTCRSWENEVRSNH